MNAVSLILAGVLAQGLELRHVGGALPGATTLEVTGEAGELYLIVGAIEEEQTPIAPGVTLEVNLDFLDFTFMLPGFFGFLDGGGQASGIVALPDDPTLAQVVLSFQAIQGAGLDAVSNLCRVTPAAPGTVTRILNLPIVPLGAGAASTQPDGSVIIAGGSGLLVRRYLPWLEDFEDVGISIGAGALSTATVLADGRILFAGGIGLDGAPAAEAALFDPDTGLTTIIQMAAPRAGHAASLMNDGRVLVTGGFSVFDLTDVLAFLSGVQASAEIFNPSTDSFSGGGLMLEPRAMHTQTTLTGGKVMVAGGITLIPFINLPTVSNTAYIYNPTFGTWSLPKLMAAPRFMHSAVALDDGRALVVGGLGLDLSGVITSGDLTQVVVETRDDGEIYTDGFFGSFQTVAGMSSGRTLAGLAPLPGGGALVVGGLDLYFDASDPLASVYVVSETCDVLQNDAWSPTGSMAWPRLGPLCHTLPDGTVMLVGGGPLDVETYQP